MERTSSVSDWSDVDEISTARFSQEEGALHSCVTGWKSHLPGRCGHAMVYSNRHLRALNAVCSFSPQHCLHNPFLYVIISSG